MKLLLQLLANGLVNGALFAMVAVGFGLVWRSLRVFHIAYGGLFMVSSYAFYALVVMAGLPVTVAVLLTLILAAVMGLLMEVCLYRPFYRQRASSGAVLIASLGVLVILENVIAILFGNEIRSIPRGVAPACQLGPVVLTNLQMVQFAVGSVVVVLVAGLMRRWRIFKALWAMGDQPELISVLGLPLYMLRTLALVLSTMLVAIPASLICLDVGTDPHIGMSYLLIAAVAVLVGGVNSYSGWVSGAVVLAVLQSLVVWAFSARWMDLVTFALLVMMLVFRPRGLMESEKRLEEPA